MRNSEEDEDYSDADDHLPGADFEPLTPQEARALGWGLWAAAALLFGILFALLRGCA